jgi:hypothetical protein
MALVIAACGGEADDTTTTTQPETTTTERETTTTSQLGTTSTAPATTPTWVFDCHPSDPEVCANVQPGASTPAADNAIAPLGGLEHYCEFYPGQALISQNAEVDPVVFGPVEAIDLFLSDAGDQEDEAQAVLDFYAEGGIAAYKLLDPGADEADLFAAIDAIQAQGPESLASPHYLLRPAPYWKYGPESTVTRLDAAWTWGDLSVTGPNGESGGRLVVIDTGANGDLTEIDVTVSEPEAIDIDPRYVGHGSFAASIAKQYNPGLNVELWRASWEDGTFSEATVVAAFQRFMAADPTPATVSLSAGTYPCGDTYNPLGLELAMSSQVVAASGNDGNTHMPPQLYPASHPDVIGVSAFDVDWTEARWANPGEVYAPGEDVVGWYHDGGSQSVSSLAVWSGTSFATPHYAACVASFLCP